MSLPHSSRSDLYANNVAFGSFYSRHVEALTGTVNDAKDPDKVAKLAVHEKSSVTKSTHNVATVFEQRESVSGLVPGIDHVLLLHPAPYRQARSRPGPHMAYQVSCPCLSRTDARALAA